MLYILPISYNLIGNTSLLHFIILLIDQLNLASINIMLILYYLVVNLTLIWLASSSCATIRHLPVALIFIILDMHPLAAASRSRLLCSKRPIMRSALNVSLRKT